MSFFSVHCIYRKVRRAKCVIAKAYKLTYSTDNFRFCLDKSYGNEKRFSAAGQIISYRKKLIANRTNCILMKAVVSNRTNRIVMHRLLVSCSNAPLCHNLLSGQIRSYWHRYVLCLSLRRCGINGYFQNNCFNYALLEYCI